MPTIKKNTIRNPLRERGREGEREGERLTWVCVRA
jgi:hypothetical protein